MTRNSARSAGRLAVAPLLALGALVACGSGKGTTTSTTASTASTTTSTSTTATTAPASTTTTTAPATTSLRVYFLKGDKIGVARRTGAVTPTPATAAVTDLLAGPTAAERAAGFASAIPTGVTLNGITIAGGVAKVDLSKSFESGGGSLSMTARLAQVTFTVTQFPSVTGVQFLLDGTPVDVFGGEGIILDHPATRASFDGVQPTIFVDQPVAGDTVSSPVQVTGTSNVFEATSRIEIVDGRGKVVGSATVTATAGTGTRGTFAVSVPYSGGQAGPGKIVSFDQSAKDGSRIDVTEIPVVLAG